ncbi:hypothetical protein [Streptacidiphilus jiangxiensis]|uniref:Uncharacterized protein n=1 Tax=Streptacidiphilus jiangxiensis TaxID=235985 RepID=A0A1H7JHF2_STRJI|nr:hypothetical protein [Streptacidiphilus jiangxiensis]SEK74041.1 hypothetical protein SAMN05414137_103297 [Streptacidiphilus jiangxiensis]
MYRRTRRFPVALRRRGLLAVVAASALLAPLAAVSSSADAEVVARGNPGGNRAVPTEHNVPFSTRWSADIHGTITSVGNSIVTCDPTKPKREADAPDCLTARQQVPPTVGTRAGRNNDYWMQYINIDGPGHKGPLGDPVYSSSSAEFKLPHNSEVKFARLYWGGTYGIVIPHLHVNVQKTIDQVDEVYFRTPKTHGYVNVKRDTAIGFDATDPDHSYGTSADVTDLVKAGGDGTYEVADVDTALAVDSWGGWSLVVGYENCDKPLRHLQVWDGYQHQAIRSGKTVSVALSGLHTPDSGTVGLRLGQITYDGDRGWGDRVNVIPDKGSPFALGDALSPTDDVQNSVLANNDPNDSNYRWHRNPDYANTLGYDNHRFLLDGMLANGTSRLTIDYPSTGEGTNIGAVYAVVDLAH